MHTTEPKIENRSEQPYMAIRNQVPMSELPNFIPASIGAVAGWLGEHGIEPTGAPIIRYHVINMDTKLDVEVGFPVAKAAAGADNIQPGVLPAGRYASLIYTGVENGIPGNGVLVKWAEDQNVKWDRWDTDEGDNFAGRVEHLIDGPDDDPNPANWRTEVAIKLAE